LNDSTVIYSSYIHLKDIYVKSGQEVNQDTEIGVLYSSAEALKYNGNYDHLHFEIKSRIDDYSCASWLCMSRKELDEYFIDPLTFLTSRINH
jgi:murein DD-endopeptidase MepM/ murein hydrolase activator NlpD